jgi:hypothetical protein
MVKHDCLKEKDIAEVRAKVDSQSETSNLILKRIDELRTFKHQEHIDMREVFETKLTGMHAENIAHNEVLLSEISKLAELQRIANGRVSKAETHIEKMAGDILVRREFIDKRIEDLEKVHKIVRFINKYPVRAILIVVSVVAFLFMLVDYLGVKAILTFVK